MISIYLDRTGDFRNSSFMQEWEDVYAQTLKVQLPSVSLLSLSYELLIAPGSVADKLRAMSSFESLELDQIFEELIERFDEEVCQQDVCMEFDAFMLAKIRSHSLTAGLLSRDQQQRFVEVEEALAENVISFYPSQDVSANDADDFLKSLCSVSAIGTTLYYLTNYGISTDSYGYNRVSYTLLEKDLSERLAEKVVVKAIPDLLFPDLNLKGARIARLGLRGPVHVMDIIEDFILSVRNACSLIIGEITLEDILKRNIFMRDSLETVDINPHQIRTMTGELKEAVRFLSHFIGEGKLGVFEVYADKSVTDFGAVDNAKN